ncbi:MAG TPA: anti-anti-sigma factor [Rhodospirillaceae bacterium]|nr:anti-anti-sigma factor [Rhodospirillaceae bacterium]HAA91610.1 anti-anti-sigma factor [Rhodospirillaceae bacterium]HAT35527.1 anti-anti-sigma factor [Rhodospirillaceae bacterium]
MDFKVEDREDGLTVIMLEGSLDFLTANDIDLEFNAVAASRDKILVDLEKVSFMASLGVRTLIKAARTVGRRDGKIVASNASAEVMEVLEYTGADKLITIHPDNDTAFADLKAS